MSLWDGHPVRPRLKLPRSFGECERPFSLGRTPPSVPMSKWHIGTDQQILGRTLHTLGRTTLPWVGRPLHWDGPSSGAAGYASDLAEGSSVPFIRLRSGARVLGEEPMNSPDACPRRVCQSACRIEVPHGSWLHRSVPPFQRGLPAVVVAAPGRHARLRPRRRKHAVVVEAAKGLHLVGAGARVVPQCGRAGYRYWSGLRWRAGMNPLRPRRSALRSRICVAIRSFAGVSHQGQHGRIRCETAQRNRRPHL